MERRNSNSWWGRLIFAILMLCVVSMPVGPDNDDDEFDGPTVMHQTVRDDRHHVQIKHDGARVSVAYDPSAVVRTASLAASLDAPAFTLLFTPIPLAAHPLRP